MSNCLVYSFFILFLGIACSSKNPADINSINLTNHQKKVINNNKPLPSFLTYSSGDFLVELKRLTRIKNGTIKAETKSGGQNNQWLADFSIKFRNDTIIYSSSSGIGGIDYDSLGNLIRDGKNAYFYEGNTLTRLNKSADSYYFKNLSNGCQEQLSKSISTDSQSRFVRCYNNDMLITDTLDYNLSDDKLEVKQYGYENEALKMMKYKELLNKKVIRKVIQEYSYENGLLTTKSEKSTNNGLKAITNYEYAVDNEDPLQITVFQSRQGKASQPINSYIFDEKKRLIQRWNYQSKGIKKYKYTYIEE